MVKIIAFILVVTFSLLSSCIFLSSKEIELRNSLGTKLKTEMLDTIYIGDSVISFKNLLQQYDFISIVYLEDGCNPCFPKFLDWQMKIEANYTPSNYTVLFIILGSNYNSFMNNMRNFAFEQFNIKTMNYSFYVAMDAKHLFIQENLNIPRWIFDSSLLIDQKGRIIMVGSPWANPKMTNLFYEICGTYKKPND